MTQILAFDFAKHTICETDEFGNWIAVNPVAVEAPLRIGFFTLSHHRVSEVREIVVDEPDSLEWVDTEGRRMFLRPLTLAAYRKFRGTIDGKDFGSQDELRAAIGDAVRRVH